MNPEQKPVTKSAKLMSKREIPDIDDYVDTALKQLLDIHTKISMDNQKLNEPALDLAMEKLGQVMTTLGKRNAARRKEANGKAANNTKG